MVVQNGNLQSTVSSTHTMNRGALIVEKFFFFPRIIDGLHPVYFLLKYMIVVRAGMPVPT